MKSYIPILKEHGILFSRDVFYILLNCIDKNINTFEQMVQMHEIDGEFVAEYKKFYEELISYFKSMDINKDFSLHHKIIVLIDLILENKTDTFKQDLKVFISNVVDLVFVKYNLNIDNFQTNEEIKDYFLEIIKDEKIVDLLMLLLLADTSLSFEGLKEIPNSDIETIIRSLILISIYICKGEK